MNQDATIVADLDGVPYPIFIGRGVIDRVGQLVSKKTKNTKVLIVTDTYFSNNLAQDIKNQFSNLQFDVLIHTLDAGKGNKNISEALKVYSVLEENDFARDSTLIALGGGVIGDMAGFIASTWLRGMNLVHIPTTMMAIIDSSIGGKTAINFRHTINGIGSYYHPILNVIDLNLIDSLPNRDYVAGIAEVIKCGIINDAEFLKYIDENSNSILDRNEIDVIEFVKRTINIKIKHVQGDVKEGSKRLLLNYGHTLGHSIEISTVKDGHEQLRHGEGVSIGIMAVAYIATHHLGVPSSTYDYYKSIFEKYGLPTFVSSSKMGMLREELLEACLANVFKDKKRLNNKLRIILAPKIGEASVFDDVPLKLIEDAFYHIIRE